MHNEPLVSIAVITYNSSEYVIETLESIKQQTYNNLEIIISDDCSTDNTVEICEKWINGNKDRFVRTAIILTPVNTGIVGNNNRALRACNGVWIKFLAGDDLLYKDAIERYIDYVSGNINISQTISNITCFDEYGNTNIDDDRDFTRYMCRDQATVKDQFSVITKMFFGDGPSYFVKKSALLEVGSFDERFPMQEDYPLYIRMLKSGYRLYYLDRETVRYRVRNDSVSHISNCDSFFSSNFIRVVKDYRFLYRKESSNFFWKIMHYISLSLCDNVIGTGNNKKSIRCRFAYMLYKLFDPYCWYARYMYKKMRKDSKIKKYELKHN